MPVAATEENYSYKSGCHLKNTCTKVAAFEEHYTRQSIEH
jgi:hypothetical protein